MKIVQVIPGSGGGFYCQNCVRDGDLFQALQTRGHDVIPAPMYLPLFLDHPDMFGDAPVFFGAVNIYLQQTLPVFRATPRWLDKLIDSGPMLRLAARASRSTDAEGLGAMTISMLRGEEGLQRKELRRLVSWMKDEIKPDVVHLSNALLLGLAPSIRQETGARLTCALQDEDTWVDALEGDEKSEVEGLMAQLASHVTLFVAPSRHFAAVMEKRLAVPPERIRVIHPGIDVSDRSPVEPPARPTVGFLSRMTPSLGLGELVETVFRMRRRPGLASLLLKATGGAMGSDHRFIESLQDRAAAESAHDALDFSAPFDRDGRRAFLRSLSLFSVPAPGGEAFGLPLLEAMAHGVPVVQPDIGGYSEIVRDTGGGLLYDPTEAGALETALAGLLDDPDRARELGAAGRTAVLDRFHRNRMATDMESIFEQAAQEKRP